MPFVTKQQTCGFAFTAICCFLFGGAIIACSTIFLYHDTYNEDRVNGRGLEGGYQYYYTHYWLGLPLIVLGIVILSLLCSKAKFLLYFCTFLSTLTLVLAITAVVLEGPKWRVWLAQRLLAVDTDETEDTDGNCIGDGVILPLNSTIANSLMLSCKEILFATVMQSVLTISSIFAIVVCQFVAFISMQALGSMSQASYEVDKHERDVVYGNGSNVHIMSQM